MISQNRKLQLDGQNKSEQEKNLTENIENAFAMITDNAEKFITIIYAQSGNVQIYVILTKPK